MDVNVDVGVKLLDTTVSLRDILNFQVGDILNVDIPENLLVSVEDLPSYHGKLGRTKDKLAVKISEVLERPKSVKNDLSFIKGNSITVNDEDELEEFDDD